MDAGRIPRLHGIMPVKPQPAPLMRGLSVNPARGWERAYRSPLSCIVSVDTFHDCDEPLASRSTCANTTEAEIDLLNRENEMSVEELRAMYANMDNDSPGDDEDDDDSVPPSTAASEDTSKESASSLLDEDDHEDFKHCFSNGTLMEPFL